MQKFNKKGCRLKGSLFFLLIIAAYLSGCKPASESDLQKTWISKEFTTASGMKLGGYKKIFTLYPNGNYTIIGGENEFAIGRWSVSAKNKMLRFVHQGGNAELDAIWLYKQPKSNRLKVELYRNQVIDEEFMEGTIELEGYQPGKAEIFSMNANTWRVNPLMPETGEQIKQRVLAYLHFMEGLYEFCSQNDIEPQQLNCHPNAVQLRFGNLIRLAYQDELQSWNSCFYDSVQAVRGYQVLSGVFKEAKMKNEKSLADRNIQFIRDLIVLVQKNTAPNPT